MTTDREREAREWSHKHCWDIPTKGMQEREESCYQAYLAGAATRDDDWQDNLIQRLQSDRAALLGLVRELSLNTHLDSSRMILWFHSGQIPVNEHEAQLFTEATKDK